MIELDHLNVELSGSNLIEASAGSGKTYAIACLYLRLLIEQELAPEQILVVTYTEAATRELRGRIRNRIKEALGVFDGAATDDPFLAGLYGAGPLDSTGKAKAHEILDRALKTFDLASIFTIHGFCLRALQDNVFESGSRYDTELVTDQDRLLQEIVDDFWRLHFFGEPAPLLAHALRKRYSPASLKKFVQDLVTNPNLQVIPRFSTHEIQVIEDQCSSAFQRVQQAWEVAGEEISDIIVNHKGLSRSADNYRGDLLPSLLDGMVAFLAGDSLYDLFEGFDKFCAGKIEKQRLKKHAPPDHTFFDLCEDLQKKIEERFLALRWELVVFVKGRLPARKRKNNIRFFDDLLNDLHAALHGDKATVFAGALRDKYRAALIDEFQDTDPIQYDIFRTIYAGSRAPLFLIGDPKQAIYSFRGADIFAYMHAAREVPDDQRFTLTGNWRSTPSLLTAFNTVFANDKRPFLYEDISYHAVRSGQKNTDRQLTMLNDSAPLQVWRIPPGDDGAAISVGTANRIIPAAVAAEISKLLQEGAEGKALLHDRPLAAADMAVIVRSHRQAASMQEALRVNGIPSVMRSDMSIFSTAEACEVCTLLRAVADPGNETKIRTALVTDLLGRSGNDIAVLLEEEQAWEQCLESFRQYHHTWLERGFMVMVHSLMSREGVRGRLLRRSDGARRLTNLLHCFDVIHQKAHERGPGMEGLLSWFSERITAGDAAEEYQIRLETDEKAVKIVTVHVSKGLEYPVVFCPFMWSGVRDSDEVATFHDGFTMIKDFGSADFDRHQTMAQQETLAESLRLLYVGLTRAKFRCYLIAGKFSDRTKRNRPETSPLAYLFHASADTRESKSQVNDLAFEVAGLPESKMAEQLQSLEGQGKGAITVVSMPELQAVGCDVELADDGEPLAARTFSGTVSSDWRVASFTSFSAHEATAHELPDRDAASTLMSPARAATDEIPVAMSIFTFPKGAQAGIFLHGLFEELNFAEINPERVETLVGRGLVKYGYDSAWLPHVSTMVMNVVTTPLMTPEGIFTLGSLRKGSWSVELEFFFPLEFITADLLAGYLRQSSYCGGADFTRIGASLSFKPVRGMVRGFMDMVFEQGGKYYLVDWKSNHLGYRVEDYHREALHAAMEQHLYPLQYLLYTVALNRYLTLRVKNYDYSTHFGGVVYVFLRGISPQHGEQFGFYRDLPPKELIDQLTQVLIAMEADGDVGI